MTAPSTATVACTSSPLHAAILSWGAVPKVAIGGELFYDTKGIFPKHNLGRDVARYCEPGDWYKSKKRFFLNARAIVALAFGKKIPNVQALIWARLGLARTGGHAAQTPLQSQQPPALARTPPTTTDYSSEELAEPATPPSPAPAPRYAHAYAYAPAYEHYERAYAYAPYAPSLFDVDDVLTSEAHVEHAWDDYHAHERTLKRPRDLYEADAPLERACKAPRFDIQPTPF